MQRNNFFPAQRGQQSSVEEITIDMHSNQGGAASFFSGGYQPDYRVQKVLDQATDDFYREQERKRQVEEYYQRQVNKEAVEQQIRQQDFKESKLAEEGMLKKRLEHEQAALLDRQM